MDSGKNSINGYVHVECQIVNVLRHRTDIYEVYEVYVEFQIVRRKRSDKDGSSREPTASASTKEVKIIH